MTVYEVFDADPPFIAKLKNETRNDFENGLINYREKSFSKAISCFKQVLSINVNDQVAKIYLERCQHWQQIEVPNDWEGIETFGK
ncbi:MAG: hypothetical protein QM487_15410 [Candidatus Marithrix sp.]